MSVLVVGALAALAQARPPGAPPPALALRLDGGVGDGGVPAVVMPPDASVIFATLKEQSGRIGLAEKDAAEARLEVERLRKEIAEIRERTALIEKRTSSSAEARTDALSGQLDKLSQQISDLKSQVTDEQDRRQQGERRAADRRAQEELAISALRAADQTLASGNTDYVDDAIRLAEGAFTGPALRYVQFARQAFSNHDLSATRTYLAYAISAGHGGPP